MKFTLRHGNISLLASFAVFFNSIASSQTPESCPNELFIGYYLEDSFTNPEDPTPGSLHLTIPRTQGQFEGQLFFTYVGCQSQNIGEISGTKSFGPSNLEVLNGQWSGVVDNTNQQGLFNGIRDSDGSFRGTYNVAAGKQKIEIQDCIEYYIAPNGTWSLFPILEESPDDQLLTVSEEKIEWTPVSGALITQCQFCLLYTSPSPRDATLSRMPSSA